MPQRDRNKLDEKKVDSENMAKETDKLTRIRTNRYQEDYVLVHTVEKKNHTHKANVYKSIYILCNLTWTKIS